MLFRKRNLLATDTRRSILYLSQTEPGSVHDFKALEASDLPYKIPKAVTIWIDSGFQSIQKKCPQHIVYLPYKKNGFLSSIKQDMNKIMVSIPVRIEYVIGHVKRLRRLTDTCPNRRKQLQDTMMPLACGLWNLWIATR